MGLPLPFRGERDGLSLLIDNEDHYAEAAASGALGLTELKEGEFDAVLLDLYLGAEKGLDILEQVLKREPNLSVVMFTAQGNVKNATLTGNAKGSGWIKPAK